MIVQSTEIPEFYNWLLFDGTAYIETDIIPDENASFLLAGGAEITDGPSKYLLCYTGTNSTKTGLFENSSSSTTSSIWATYYNSTSSLGSKSISTYYPTYDLFLTPKCIGFTSASTTTFTKGDGVPTGNLILGCSDSYANNYDGGTVSIKIYGSDAQDVNSYAGFADYTPVITLRPCIYKGQSGLWNVEQNKFYGNSASSGTLQAANRLRVYPSSYDTVNKSYYSASNISNGYTSASSTSYCTIVLARGEGAETYLYYNFDTSSLPANAIIHRVNCTARYYISNTTSTNVASRNIQMFSNGTAKGSALSMGSLTGRSFPTVTWTRQELENVSIRVYAKRGTANTKTGYNIRFYGAYLDIYYTV